MLALASKYGGAFLIIRSDMKSNFVVSMHSDAWIPGAKRLFAIDPYIYHVLEREERLSDFDKVEVAPILRTTRDEYLRAHEFVDRKYRQYIPIIVRRLDELHQTSLGEGFWRKALSLSLLRHVTFCYELFQACEVNFSPEHHDCRVLEADGFRVPFDFEEHRHLFQHTDFGQEQLFSVYCGLFYPGKFERWKGHFPVGKVDQETIMALPRWRRWFDPRRIVRRLLRFRSPRVAITNSYFSPENLDRLVFGSRGRIQSMSLPMLTLPKSEIRWSLRDYFVREEPDFDRFDRYVFACLRHAMPKIFIEDFPGVFSQLQSYFAGYSDLRWIVCEAWISHTLSAMALAVLKLQGVKHINNEHNYLAYPFLGNNLKYITPLVDEFVSLGWEDPSIPNLVRGASLFQWMEKDNRCEKEHDILFICGLPQTHLPEINASYGDAGAYGAQSYLGTTQHFLARLGEKTLSKLFFRAYPSAHARHFLTWDQCFALAPYITKVKTYDDSTISGRLLMQRSRLVVVNYLSTSHLESIIADIPTIFIWNKDTYLFTEKHMGIFDALIEAGVCQTNPEDAADFVNSIKDNPEEWWRSSAVRKSRDAFLKANIGDPEAMIQYLLVKAH